MADQQFVFPPRKDILGSKLRRTHQNGRVEYGIVMECCYVEGIEARQHAGWKLLMKNEKTGAHSTWTLDEHPDRANAIVEFVVLDASSDDLSALTSGSGLWGAVGGVTSSKG